MQQPCIALLTKSKFDSFLSPPWPHYLKKGQVPIHPKVLTPQRLSSAHWPPPWPERESAVWLWPGRQLEIRREPDIFSNKLVKTNHAIIFMNILAIQFRQDARSAQSDSNWSSISSVWSFSLRYMQFQRCPFSKKGGKHTKTESFVNTFSHIDIHISLFFFGHGLCNLDEGHIHVSFKILLLFHELFSDGGVRWQLRTHVDHIVQLFPELVS